MCWGVRGEQQGVSAWTRESFRGFRYAECIEVVAVTNVSPVVNSDLPTAGGDGLDVFVGAGGRVCVLKKRSVIDVEVEVMVREKGGGGVVN